MTEPSRAHDLGLDEEQLAAVADEISPALVSGLCEALVRYDEALAELGLS